MAYRLLKRVIEAGNYDRADIADKIDVYRRFNRLTEAEYRELRDLLDK